MFRKFIARTKMAIEPDALPRSLRSVADVRAARTEEKIGHSGRDDRKGKFAPLHPAASHFYPSVIPPAPSEAEGSEAARFVPPRRIWARRAAQRGAVARFQTQRGSMCRQANSSVEQAEPFLFALHFLTPIPQPLPQISLCADQYPPPWFPGT